MSWTAPHTWATDEVLTAALLNSNARDNLAFLASAHAYAHVQTSSAQTVATSGSIIAFGTTAHDNTGMHTAASRLTFQAGNGGAYLFTAYLGINSSAAGRRGILFYYNGGNYGSGAVTSPPGDDGYWDDTCSMLIAGAVGTYVEVLAYTDTTALGCEGFFQCDWQAP